MKRQKRYLKSSTVAKNPINLRVYNKPIADDPDDPAVGQCWPHTRPRLRKIEIDPRQSPKDYLDTLLHEAIHENFPKVKEPKVLNAATSIANLLWRLGYRRIHQKPKKKH